MAQTPGRFEQFKKSGLSREAFEASNPGGSVAVAGTPTPGAPANRTLTAPQAVQSAPAQDPSGNNFGGFGAPSATSGRNLSGSPFTVKEKFFTGREGDVITSKGGALEHKFGSKGFEGTARNIFNNRSGTTAQRQDFRNLSKLLSRPEDAAQFAKFNAESGVNNALQAKIQSAMGSVSQRSVTRAKGMHFSPTINVGGIQVENNDQALKNAQRELIKRALTPEEFERYQAPERGQAIRLAEVALQKIREQGEQVASGQQDQGKLDFGRRKEMNKIAQSLEAVGVSQEDMERLGLGGFQTFNEGAEGQRRAGENQKAKVQRRLSEGKISQEKADSQIGRIDAESAFLLESDPGAKEGLRQLSSGANKAAVEAGHLAITPGQKSGPFTATLDSASGFDQNIQQALTKFDAKDQELLMTQLEGGSPEARAFALEKLGLPPEEVGTTDSQVLAASGEQTGDGQATSQTATSPADGGLTSTTTQYPDITSLVTDLIKPGSDVSFTDAETQNTFDSITNTRVDTVKNFEKILNLNEKSSLEQRLQQATNITKGFEDADGILEGLLDDIKTSTDDLEDAAIETRDIGVETAAFERSKSERTLTRAEAENKERFDSAIAEQRQSVIDQRVRDETFLGLRGGWGSGAGMENIDRAEQQGRSILASLEKSSARSTEEFASKYSDLGQQYTLNIRTLNNDKDAKIAQFNKEAGDQIRQIQTNRAMTNIQKTSEINRIVESVIGDKTATATAVAGAMLGLGQAMASDLLNLKSFEYQKSQDAIANKLRQDQLDISRAKLNSSRDTDKGTDSAKVATWDKFLKNKFGNDYSPEDIEISGAPADIKENLAAIINLEQLARTYKGDDWSVTVEQGELIDEQAAGIEALYQSGGGDKAGILQNLLDDPTPYNVQFARRLSGQNVELLGNQFTRFFGAGRD